MSSLFGLHEITFHPVPDDILRKIDPLVHVIVGTAQTAGESVMRADHVCNLLPKATVILRLWPDDHQYNQMTPVQWSERYLPYTSKSKWYLSIDNEPLASSDEKQLLAVRDWELAVLKLANRAGVRIAYGAFSTGTPHHTLYHHLVPLWKEAALLGPRQHVWRPNCYWDPNDPGYRNNHLLRPIVYGWKAAADAGLSAPFTVYGETGIAPGYNPEKGYKSIGIGGRDFARRLVAENLPVAAAVFCWGPWKDNSYSVNDDPDFIDELATLGAQRVDWPTYPAANANGWAGMFLRSTANYSNIRQTPSTTSAISGRLPQTATPARVNRLSRWFSPTDQRYWYPVELGTLRGWLREDVWIGETKPPANAVWKAARFTNNTSILDYPFGPSVATALKDENVTAAFATPLVFNNTSWTAINRQGKIGWALSSQLVEVAEEQILLVPYYSLHGYGGTGRRSEALAACARMLLSWSNLARGLRDLRRPAISDFQAFLDIEPGQPISLAQTADMLEMVGVKSRIDGRLTTTMLENALKAGTPIVVTLAYDLLPGRQDVSATGAQAVLVLGLSSTHVIVHDPNWKGSDMMHGSYWRIDRAAFWKAVEGLANGATLIPVLPTDAKILQA